MIDASLVLLDKSPVLVDIRACFIRFMSRGHDAN
jgi:hypothetical protein